MDSFIPQLNNNISCVDLNDTTNILNNISNIQNNLLKFPNSISESNKNILDILSKLISEINSLLSLDKLFNIHSFYIKNKNLLSIIQSMSFSKSDEVSSKITQIKELITQLFIKHLFIYLKNEEINFMNKEINSINTEDILKEIEYLNNHKSTNEISVSQSECIDNKNDDLFLLFKMDSDLIVEKFKNISKEFFSSVYNKNPNLSLSDSNKRKNVCIKIMNLLKTIFPDFDENDLKLITIYTEYKSRMIDNTFGDKYYSYLNYFCSSLKNR